MTNPPRPDLDAAIDRVAARMVAIDEGVNVLPGVMAQLPEREATRWFLAWPVQLAAGAAVVLVAFLSARPSREVTSRASLPGTVGSAMIEAQLLEAPRVPVAAVIPDPRSLLREGFGGRAPIPDLALDRPDHERSLTPVEPLQTLAIEPIAPAALEPDVMVVLAPLVLTELTLAGESSPQER